MKIRSFISGCEGTQLSPAETAFFHEQNPWGLILFKRNCETPAQLKALTSAFREAVGRRDAPVFIQSFETANLRELRQKTPVRLIQLGATAAMFDDAGLKAIAAYADGIGAEKSLVIPVGADGRIGSPTDLVARAHAARLLVHVWTIRIDREFLPGAYAGKPEAEFQRFRGLRVDGIFADFPDVAVRAFR